LTTAEADDAEKERQETLAADTDSQRTEHEQDEGSTP
jgi:hypothetical protein